MSKGLKKSLEIFIFLVCRKRGSWGQAAGKGFPDPGAQVPGVRACWQETTKRWA